MADNPLRITVGVFHEATQWVLDERHVQRIRQAADEVQVRVATGRASLLKLLPETDVLFGWSLSEQDFREHGGSLQWVQLTTVGGETVLNMPAVREAKLRLTTAASVHRIQAAEHVMALTLALSRRLHRCMQAQFDREWVGDRVGPEMGELYGQTMGIVAISKIGEEIAARAKAFGMHVLATKKHPAQEYLFVDQVLPADALDEMLGESDVVIVAVPLTGETRRLIGRKQFKVMRSSALLVNASRSAVVDERAMIRALKDGRIAGAGLDVFETEPLPDDSSLWHMANVIITPHVAGASPHYWDRATALFCDNLRRFLGDQPLVDEVNPEAGY